MTNEPISHVEPSHALVAIRRCGCLMLAGVDLPANRPQLAKGLAQCIVAGAIPGHWTIERVKASSWECPSCAMEPEFPLLLGNVRDPVMLLTGSLTMRVTVAFNDIPVRAEQDDDAFRERLFQAMRPYILYSDEADTDVEFDREDLTLRSSTAAEDAARDPRQQHLFIV